MEAIVLAGGFGTRLQKIVRDVPKPMADINGKPFLKYLLDYLISYKINRIILSVGYKAEIIQNYFRNEYKDVPIIYVVEKSPLGTGGAIKKSLEFCHSENILVLNGDSFYHLNIEEFKQFHINHTADISLALKPMKQFQRYGNVKVDGNRVVEFQEKQYQESGFINGGVYLIKKGVIEQFPLPETFSIETDFFQKYINQINIRAYQDSGYFIDIGIPEDYEKANLELLEMSIK